MGDFSFNIRAMCALFHWSHGFACVSIIIISFWYFVRMTSCHGFKYIHIYYHICLYLLSFRINYDLSLGLCLSMYGSSWPVLITVFPRSFAHTTQTLFLFLGNIFLFTLEWWYVTNISFWFSSMNLYTYVHNKRLISVIPRIKYLRVV